MIYTGNYENFKNTKYRTISISCDGGKEAEYKGIMYPKLAPKEELYEKWHNNIRLLTEEENNKIYIEEYYKQVLKELDPEDVYQKLDNRILLCYEKSNKFCHRHIVSAWLELYLEKEIYEVKEIENNLIIENKPQYIKDILEKVIRENIDMKGYNSIKDVYLFEKANNIDNSIKKRIK